jgi:membrane protease YdiL (CAAX protease family)
VKIKKFEFLFIWALSIFWILLSSIRAGGDMWDNPRYRLSFLIFIAYIVGVAFYHGWKTKDHWLTRFFVAELVFVLFFLQWYISRYTGLFENLPFFHLVLVLSIIFGIILLTGIIEEIKIYKLNMKNKKFG